MTLHPEIQSKAQDELNTVIGPLRLPEFGDYELLPYIRAIILETLRWVPVLPLGVAHAASADDHYEGYFIPKGTTIVPVSSP